MPSREQPSTSSKAEQLTIRQGRIDLSFHQVVGEVFANVLSDPRLLMADPVEEKSVPQPEIQVDVSSAAHPDAFAALQRGETDILVGWFDGSHGTYIDPFRSDVIILGSKSEPESVYTPPVYTPYCIWGVPSFVPKAIVPNVQSLANPTVAARFGYDTSVKKRILQGIAPGAGISRFSKEMVQTYSLSAQDWEFRSGTQEECFGNVEQKMEAEEWFVVPLWHPQYLHSKYSLRALQEPKGLLRPVDEARLVLRKEFLQSFPDEKRNALLSVLSRVSLGNDAVTLMDSYVHVEKMSYREAARKWIREHQAQVDSWFVNGHADIVRRASELSSYKLVNENGGVDRSFSIPAKAPAAAGAYSAFSLSSGSPRLIHTSFQLPWELNLSFADGDAPRLAYVGPVTTDEPGGKIPSVGEADGLASARICALNLLAQLRDAADGDLARIQLLRLEGYVATTDTAELSVNVPRILDAASVLLKHALGPEQGNHSRTALILQKNPLNVPTMLGAVAELRW